MARPNRKILLSLFAGFIIIALLPAIIIRLKKMPQKKMSDANMSSPVAESNPTSEAVENQHESDYLSGNYAAQAEKWEKFLNSELDWKKPIASQVEAFRISHGVPIIIWGEGDETVIDYKLGPHPCGKIKTVFADKLSSPSGKPFALGKALEVKDKKIIQTWLLPIDEVPLALDRDKVLLEYPVSSESGSAVIQLGIKTNGQFEFEEKQIEYHFSPEKYIECPAFENDAELRSDFTRCYEYEDLSTHSKRILVFEQPCT